MVVTPVIYMIVIRVSPSLTPVPVLGLGGSWRGGIARFGRPNAKSGWKFGQTCSFGSDTVLLALKPRIDCKPHKALI